MRGGGTETDGSGKVVKRERRQGKNLKRMRQDSTKERGTIDEEVKVGDNPS